MNDTRHALQTEAARYQVAQLEPPVPSPISGRSIQDEIRAIRDGLLGPASVGAPSRDLRAAHQLDLLIHRLQVELDREDRQHSRDEVAYSSAEFLTEAR